MNLSHKIANPSQIHNTLNPIYSFHEHTREVHSADYNPVCRDSFLSSSWDDIIKLWTLDRPTSVRTFKEHARLLRLLLRLEPPPRRRLRLRLRQLHPPRLGRPRARLHHELPAHDFEILACDWNKYDDCMLRLEFSFFFYVASCRATEPGPPC